MVAAETRERAEKKAILLEVPAEMKVQIERAAAVRRTSVRSTAVWLLAHGVEWFEGLSREQRESA